MHIKLKGSPIICLVGFMGCGKTTIGRLLAERLGWTFIDLDEEIERRSGKSIAEIFERDGEPRFRDLEHESLSEHLALACQGRPQVVALGGGAFADARNREKLGLCGVSIWLDCPTEKLWPRVAGFTHRPLAHDREQFDRLHRDRVGYYRMADFRVGSDTDRPEDAVNAILHLPLF